MHARSCVFALALFRNSSSVFAEDIIDNKHSLLWRFCTVLPRNHLSTTVATAMVSISSVCQKKEINKNTATVFFVCLALVSQTRFPVFLHFIPNKSLLPEI